MSDSVDELYQQLLDLGMSEQELEKKVKNKVEEYGGFMTKQGVLFIIARENGLELRSPEIDSYLYDELEEEVDYNEFTIDISDIKEGMTNIVLLGKILRAQKVREFVRKDQSVGKVCSFLLSDLTGTMKIVLITNANSEDSSTMDNRKPLKQALQQNKYLSIVTGIVQIEEFKELELKSGDKSFMLALLLEVDDFTIRVKAWGMKAVECLKAVNDGDSVSITNLVVKESKYTGEKELAFTKNSKVLLI